MAHIQIEYYIPVKNNISLCLAESPRCSPETVITLLTGYTLENKTFLKIIFQRIFKDLKKYLLYKIAAAAAVEKK